MSALPRSSHSYFTNVVLFSLSKEKLNVTVFERKVTDDFLWSWTLCLGSADADVSTAIHEMLPCEIVSIRSTCHVRHCVAETTFSMISGANKSIYHYNNFLNSRTSDSKSADASSNHQQLVKGIRRNQTRGPDLGEKKVQRCLTFIFQTSDL